MTSGAYVNVIQFAEFTVRKDDRLGWSRNLQQQSPTVLLVAPGVEPVTSRESEHVTEAANELT